MHTAPTALPCQGFLTPEPFEKSPSRSGLSVALCRDVCAQQHPSESHDEQKQKQCVFNLLVYDECENYISLMMLSILQCYFRERYPDLHEYVKHSLVIMGVRIATPCSKRLITRGSRLERVQLRYYS